MAEKQFSTLYIDNAAFGINILLIREINRNMEITPVDMSPQYVRGLMNLRGQIVTVIDLGMKLGLEPRKIKSSSQIIVLKKSQEIANLSDGENETTEDLVGLLVDRVGNVVSVDTEKIEQPPANIGSVDGRFLSGVIKMESELIVTLKIGKILSL